MLVVVVALDNVCFGRLLSHDLGVLCEDLLVFSQWIRLKELDEVRVVKPHDPVLQQQVANDVTVWREVQVLTLQATLQDMYHATTRIIGMITD